MWEINTSNFNNFPFLSPFFFVKKENLFRFSAQLRQLFSLEIRVACRISGRILRDWKLLPLCIFSGSNNTDMRGEKKQSIGKKWGWKEEGIGNCQCIVVGGSMLDRWTSSEGWAVRLKNKTRGKIAEIVPPLISLVNYLPVIYLRFDEFFFLSSFHSFSLAVCKIFVNLKMIYKKIISIPKLLYPYNYLLIIIVLRVARSKTRSSKRDPSLLNIFFPGKKSLCFNTIRNKKPVEIRTSPTDSYLEEI